MGTIYSSVRYDTCGNQYPAEQIVLHGINPQSMHQNLNTHFVIDNKVIVKKQIVVHRFTVGDVDDPDLYAAPPIYEWQQTIAGKWVMANCEADSLVWNRYMHMDYFGYHEYMIRATFEETMLTEFYLRFGNPA